jgi:hypothetical protein
MAVVLTLPHARIFLLRIGVSGTGMFNAMWMKSGAVSQASFVGAAFEYTVYA